MLARILAVLIALAILPVAATARDGLAGPEAQGPTEHAKAQVARLHDIKTLVDAGRSDDAAARIAGIRAAAGNAPDANATRIDADEMDVALLAAKGQFAEAKSASERIVKLRRAGPASEQLLLCWSLLQHTIILDATGDTFGADKHLVESIGAAREAFPASDKRRARMLEAYADLLARGYNRPVAGIALYKAAIEAREAIPDASRAEQAETLRKLAVVEPPQGLDIAADGHLQRAGALLQAEADAATDAAARKETNGDIATLLGMRAGIAARAQRFDDARTLLSLARPHAAGTASAPYMDIYAADFDRKEAESKADWPAAVAAIRRAIASAEKLPEAAPGLVASLQLVEGRLQIEQGDFAGAEASLQRALETFSRSTTPEGAQIAEGWLLLARIESARGQEARAKRWVTAALAMLKTRRSEVPVLFATNRAPRESEPQMFGAKMANGVAYGEALVLVPGAPPVPGAGLSTLGGATALEKLLVTNVQRHERDAFAAAARARSAAAKRYPKSALLFVHGFGTTFEFAVARTAQISRDIAYDGPTFLFTWPSQGKPDPLSYSADEKAANASADSLAGFIAAIPQLSGAEKIHIVAHSMGNQVLLKALGRLKASDPQAASHIGEVIFASPDVAQADFKENTGRLDGLGMTLYASAYDKALWLSSWRNWAARAGSVSSGFLSSGRPVLAGGVDSIDVSEAGRDYFSFNHDTYVSSPHVANDLRRLLQAGERPPGRRSAGVMVERGTPPERYWAFEQKAPR